MLGGWSGLKTSLLGALVGLALLLPFVLLRSLGAGDWKLAGALGAFTGPGLLIDLLLGSVFVAGVMAVALVIYKRTHAADDAQYRAYPGFAGHFSIAGRRGFRWIIRIR